MITDENLRTLYRLAERVDGPALSRVRAAIRARRATLQLQSDHPDPLAPAPRRRPRTGPRVTLPRPRFIPLAADAPALLARRRADRARAERTR